jgi:hypothetical protein
VPSKVRRFVEFLGAGLDCRELDGRKWKRWVAWLKRQVTARRLKRTTARVN